jgi:hypothetical protein
MGDGVLACPAAYGCDRLHTVAEGVLDAALGDGVLTVEHFA